MAIAQDITTTTLDGTEQTLFEGTELKVYEGDVFLNLMGSGDTVVVKVYRKDTTGGTYYLWDSSTYTNAQTSPVKTIPPKSSKYGYKVTAQRTAGTVASLKSIFWKY